MRKIINAFLDGVMTGLDPIGCALGHATAKDTPKRLIFIGHVADKYSITEPEDENTKERLIPKQRSLDEQLAKAFGDVTGLGISIASYGILQFSLGLGMPAAKYFDHRREKERARRLNATYRLY